jgi:chaperonin GroES
MLKPILNRIVVKRDEPETVSAGGIVIPDNFAEDADKGTVLAIGPGENMTDGTVKAIKVAPGARILFHSLSGHKVEVNKEEFVILKEDDILGVITE